MPCKECQPKPCTLHRWDDAKNKYVRCPEAEQSIFLTFDAIPPKYKDATLDDYKDDTPARKAAKTIAETLIMRFSEGVLPKKSIIFFGPDFAGKTFISSIILSGAIKAGNKTSIASLQSLTDFYFNDRKEYVKFYNFDVLVIQLGGEIANASSPSIIKDIFKERDMRRKYTFFTSKVALRDFGTTYSMDLGKYFHNTSVFKHINL